MAHHDRIHVIVEDCFLPSTSIVIRSICNELDSEYTDSKRTVESCAPSHKGRTRLLATVVQVASNSAKKAAKREGALTAYLMPTTIGFKLGEATGQAGVLVTVAAVKTGPVGVFIDFCDPDNTPIELIGYISRQADELKNGILRNRFITEDDGDQATRLIATIRSGLTNINRYFN